MALALLEKALNFCPVKTRPRTLYMGDLVILSWVCWEYVAIIRAIACESINFSLIHSQPVMRFLRKIKILLYSVVNINLKRVNPATHQVILYAENCLQYTRYCDGIYTIGVQNCQYSGISDIHD